MIMDEAHLIRFILGDLSVDEKRLVLKWISKSEENRKKYIELKSLTTTFFLPESRAPRSELKYLKEGVGNNNKFVRHNKTFFYKISGIVATILLLIALTLNLIQYRSSVRIPSDITVISENIPDQGSGSRYQTLYTNKGVKGEIELPDGSIVKLNSDTKIKYPENFSGKYREVEISGEALFEVKKDKDFPMLVKTRKGVDIEVTGTRFLIRSYENDESALTILLSGTINLISSDNGKNISSQELSPMESAIISNNKIDMIAQADTTKDLAWLQGKLIFEDTPINEVLKQLNRWHGADFVVNDKSILSYKITAQFRSESIVQIMEVLRFCSPIDYNIINNNIYLKKR